MIRMSRSSTLHNKSVVKIGSLDEKERLKKRKCNTFPLDLSKLCHNRTDYTKVKSLKSNK